MARIKKVLRFKRSLLDAVSSAECKRSYFSAFLGWLDDHYSEFDRLGIQDDLGMFVGLAAEELPLDWSDGVSIQREKRSLEQLDEGMKAETFTMLLRTKLWDGVVYMSEKTCLQCGHHEFLGAVEAASDAEVYFECGWCSRQYDLDLQPVEFQRRRLASQAALVKAGVVKR